MDQLAALFRFLVQNEQPTTYAGTNLELVKLIVIILQFLINACKVTSAFIWFVLLVFGGFCSVFFGFLFRLFD